MADENISGGAGVHTGPGSEGTAPDTGSPTTEAGIRAAVPACTVSVSAGSRR